MAKMTTEEAFVKVLQMHGIEHAFGIIGSAFMPISDIFPDAGITFWDVAHETNGGLIADGYTRSTGKMSMVIAQNGPGVTGLVTPIKTAYWNHTPLLLVTPQAANKTMGQGGFQEVEQLNLFKDMVCYQEEVRDPSRMAEVLNRVIEKAIRGSAPAQINVPRDYWTQVIDIDLPPIVRLERQGGGAEAITSAANLLSKAKFPVILSGAGVVIGGAIEETKKLAEKLDSPVCSGYQHNDSFPGSHPLAVGPLGYNGSKAAMELISKADVVLALGTRLNPFSTLPGYGIDYWPKKADIIHTHSYGYFQNHAGWIREKLQSTPWVITPHFHPSWSMWGGAKRRTLRDFYDSKIGKATMEAADLIIKGVEGAISSKRVTYDFNRLMDDATELKCSEFGHEIVSNMD